ncbi:hypothetical protein KFE25_001875 [Diacronema lutheri]|uniref:Sec1 family domain-containing protein 2 n=1 Tax=Diacronema lutheri TaxID=2081491 RepID=A0A8J6CB24_DIALT|nr:hypothetical protein KFE25_001875 [Diacronema lutheri]
MAPIAALSREALRRALGADARGAAVLVDEVAAQLLAENGGVALLLELGVASVVRLHAQSPRVARHQVVSLPGAPPPTHAVVLCTQPVDGLGALLDHAIDRAFERCVVLCSLASLAEHDATPDEGCARRRASEALAVRGAGEAGSAVRGEAGGEDEDAELDSDDAGEDGADDDGDGDDDGDDDARHSRAAHGAARSAPGASPVGDGLTTDDPAKYDIGHILAQHQARWSSLLAMPVTARLLRACMLPLGADAFVLAGHHDAFPLLPADAQALAEAGEVERMRWLAAREVCASADGAIAPRAGAGAALDTRGVGAGTPPVGAGRRGDVGGWHGSGEGEGGSTHAPPRDFDWEQLPPAAAASLDSLAHSLLAAVSTLGARSEFFAIGDSARLLARRMHTLPLGNALARAAAAELGDAAADARGAGAAAGPDGSAAPSDDAARVAFSRQSVAVVLVDRTLDMVTPMLSPSGVLDQLALGMQAAASDWRSSECAHLPAALGGSGTHGGGASNAAALPLAQWRADPLAAALADELLLARTGTDALLCVRDALLGAIASGRALRERIPRAADARHAPLVERATVEGSAQLAAQLRGALNGVHGANADGDGGPDDPDAHGAALRLSCVLELSEHVLRWLQSQHAQAADAQPTTLRDAQRALQLSAADGTAVRHDEICARLISRIGLVHNHTAAVSARSGEGPSLWEEVALVAAAFSLVGVGDGGGGLSAEHGKRIRNALLQACLRDPPASLCQLGVVSSAPPLCGAAGGVESAEVESAEVESAEVESAEVESAEVESAEVESAEANLKQLSAALDEALRQLMARLRSCARAREQLTTFRSLVGGSQVRGGAASDGAAGSVSPPQPFQPLVRQLVRHLLPAKGEHARAALSADVRHVSTSLGSLLQSGFSLLGVPSSRHVHPAQHTHVLVFVLGGISCAEAREAISRAAW